VPIGVATPLSASVSPVVDTTSTPWNKICMDFEQGLFPFKLEVMNILTCANPFQVAEVPPGKGGSRREIALHAHCVLCFDISCLGIVLLLLRARDRKGGFRTSIARFYCLLSDAIDRRDLAGQSSCNIPILYLVLPVLPAGHLSSGALAKHAE
jgi:hypothetical protein